MIQQSEETARAELVAKGGLADLYISIRPIEGLACRAGTDAACGRDCACGASIEAPADEVVTLKDEAEPIRPVGVLDGTGTTILVGALARRASHALQRRQHLRLRSPERNGRRCGRDWIEETDAFAFHCQHGRLGWRRGW